MLLGHVKNLTYNVNIKLNNIKQLCIFINKDGW